MLFLVWKIYFAAIKGLFDYLFLMNYFGLGELFIDWVASGGHELVGEFRRPSTFPKYKIDPPRALKEATRGQIRIGLLEFLMARITQESDLENQLDLVKKMAGVFIGHVALFNSNFYGTLPLFGKDPESEKESQHVQRIWGTFESFIVKDIGLPVPYINRDRVRSIIYPELLKDTL